LFVFFLQFDGALKTSFKKALNTTYNGNNDDLKNSFSSLFETVSMF